MCTHPQLTLLEGPLHPGGKDYYCKACGQQFTVREANVTVSYGAPPKDKP